MWPAVARATIGTMSTVVFVDPGVDQTLPAALRGAELRRERRARALPVRSRVGPLLLDS